MLTFNPTQYEEFVLCTLSQFFQQTTPFVYLSSFHPVDQRSRIMTCFNALSITSEKHYYVFTLCEITHVDRF